MFTSRNRNMPSSAEAREGACDRVVDQAFEHYMDWRRQLSTCESAYRHWATTANPRESALAFATYTAALDREERAAAQYEAALSGS